MVDKNQKLKSILIFAATTIVLGGFLALNQVIAATTNNQDLEGVANYLESKFSPNDGIGGPAISDWAMQGLAAAGRRRDYLAAYILRQTQNLSDQPATSIERTILALLAADLNPRQLPNGVDLIATLKGHHQNGQTGMIGLLNDDIFAILALLATGESIENPQVVDSLNYLLNHQKPNGGFSWSVVGTEDCNNTAVAIQAIALANKAGAETSSQLDRAKSYLLSCQNPDGGFGYQPSSSSDGASTGWAINAFSALNLDPHLVANYGQSPYDYLATLRHQEGGYGWQSNAEPNLLVSTYVSIALAGKHLPVAVYSTPVASPTPSATPSPSPTPTAIPSPAPSPAPSANISPSPNPTPTISPQPTAGLTPSPSPSASLQPSPTTRPSANPTASTNPNPSPNSTTSPRANPGGQPDPTYNQTATPDTKTPTDSADSDKTFAKINETQISEDSEAVVEYQDYSTPIDRAKELLKTIVRPTANNQDEPTADPTISPEATANSGLVSQVGPKQAERNSRTVFAALMVGLGLLLTGWGLSKLRQNSADLK